MPLEARFCKLGETSEAPQQNSVIETHQLPQSRETLTRDGEE